MQFTQQMYITVINRPINLTLLRSNNLACSITHLNGQNYAQLMSPTARITTVSLPAYVYISILCLLYMLLFKNPLINRSLLRAHVSYVSSETTVTQRKKTQIWHFSCFTFNQKYNLQRKTKLVNFGGSVDPHPV